MLSGFQKFLIKALRVQKVSRIGGFLAHTFSGDFWALRQTGSEVLVWSMVACTAGCSRVYGLGSLNPKPAHHPTLVVLG